MKKYMIFQSVVFFCMQTSLYVKPMEIQPIQDSFCYLTLLPLEILHHIAQFLPWEEQEELIKRMEREKDEEFPEEYYKYLPILNDLLSTEHIIGVFSPDKSKIALFEVLCGACFGPLTCTMCKDRRLLIVDLQEKEKDERIMYAGYVDKTCYRTIALSLSGSLYAVIKKEIKNRETSMPSCKDYQDILVVGDRIKVKECKFEIPDDFLVSHLMFNQQGTQVIAYARDYRSEPMQKKYMLFDLKQKDPNEQMVAQDKDAKNGLLDYFKHYRVCKNIKSITLHSDSYGSTSSPRTE
jgi:hypothetical protein